MYRRPQMRLETMSRTQRTHGRAATICSSHTVHLVEELAVLEHNCDQPHQEVMQRHISIGNVWSNTTVESQIVHGYTSLARLHAATRHCRLCGRCPTFGSKHYDGACFRGEPP